MIWFLLGAIAGWAATKYVWPIIAGHL